MVTASSRVCVGCRCLVITVSRGLILTSLCLAVDKYGLHASSLLAK